MIISKRFNASFSKNNNNSYGKAQLVEINKVKGKLRTQSLQLEKTQCPCQKGSDYGVIATTERYGIDLNTVICDTCGTLRFKEYLTDESLSELYINHYQRMYGRLSNIPKYFNRQKSYGKRIYQTFESMFSKGENILEIGCGAAGALNYFQQQGLNAYGCEYSETLVDYANSQNMTNIFQGSLFDTQKFFPKEIKFKIIYIHHVFEHVNDPLSLLNKCRSLLTSDGKLIIGVPDFLAIDKHKNPGCNLLPFIHIAHKYNFTNNCFHSLANQANLSYKRINLHKDYPTPWSVQPELWGEFTLSKQNESPLESTSGDEVYKYLKQCETHFENNSCPYNESVSHNKIKLFFSRIFKR